MRRTVFVGFFLICSASLLAGPSAFADSLGASTSTVQFACSISTASCGIQPGTLESNGITFDLQSFFTDGDGPVPVESDIYTNGPISLNLNTGLIAMSGTASINLNDSIGGFMSGNLVWVDVATDPNNASETDLVGEISSLDLVTFTPPVGSTNGFATYFGDLTNGGPATITVVTNCPTAPSCLSADPTGSIVSLEVTPGLPGGTPPTNTPEPGTLGLLGIGMLALFCASRRYLLPSLRTA